RQQRERGGARLVTSIRDVFRQEGVLAAIGDAAAIDEHKIVPEWPLPGRPSLRADLALKNRIMRVAKVVDLDLTEEAAPPPGLFAGVVTLDVAEQSAGAEQRVFAYRAAGSAARIEEALAIANLHASKLVNLDDATQRAEFLHEWITAAQAGAVLSV